MTIAGNTGYGIFAVAGSVTLQNTVVANNSQFPDTPQRDPANCSGSVTSRGNNLDGDGTCSLTGPGDLSKVDPKLGPLADYGGPTQTQALLPGSPAIDAGSNVDCPATDQRGFQRPRDGDGNGTQVCDIGAFESDGSSNPALCSPRPPVAVQAVPNGDGRLRVTVSVASNATTTNALRTITWDRQDNATVTLASGGPISTSQQTALPAETQTITFLVGRLAAGQATTVRFTVVDSCGPWPTFVGGEPHAF